MKIRIDGIPNPVTVDDAFADLSPEEQGAIVDEIHRQYSKIYHVSSTLQTLSR